MSIHRGGGGFDGNGQDRLRATNDLLRKYIAPRRTAVSAAGAKDGAAQSKNRSGRRCKHHSSTIGYGEERYETAIGCRGVGRDGGHFGFGGGFVAAHVYESGPCCAGLQLDRLVRRHQRRLFVAGFLGRIPSGKRRDDELLQSSPSGVAPGSVDLNPKGGLFGGQIGYNWQTGVWVLGLEADLDWADIKSSGAAVGPVFVLRGLDSFTAAATQKIDTFGTLRARIGFTPIDRVLLFATGGLAYGHTKLDTSYGDAACILCTSGSSSAWKTGWTAGAGVEWAFQNNWTLRGEYLYYDLGAVDHVLTDPTAPGATMNARAEYHGNIVRAALNYKFAP